MKAGDLADESGAGHARAPQNQRLHVASLRRTQERKRPAEAEPKERKLLRARTRPQLLGGDADVVDPRADSSLRQELFAARVPRPEQVEAKASKTRRGQALVPLVQATVL